MRALQRCHLDAGQLEHVAAKLAGTRHTLAAQLTDLPSALSLDSMAAAANPSLLTMIGC